MALLEDVFGESVVGSLGGGLAIVAGAVVVRLVLPTAARMARPLVKETIKIGMRGYDAAREMAAEGTEAARDIAAEVRAEPSPAAAPVAAPAPNRRERRKRGRKTA